MAVELLPVTFQEYTVNQWLSNGVSASKLLLAIPLYGRTYTLADPEDHGIGAPIIGSGTAGPYSAEPGFLSYYEVFQSIFL
jgi:chitinase